MNDPLKESMARTATGFACVIEGILDARTVDASKNHSAWRALHALNWTNIPGCQSPDCLCKVEALSKLEPKVQIVEVRIEIVSAAKEGK